MTTKEQNSICDLAKKHGGVTFGEGIIFKEVAQLVSFYYAAKESAARENSKVKWQD
ncbi:hypothetical protein [Sphingomonas sp.]|uniref:hypothetical protein n=1 Tax=Sphingomonas sp. TaxID=28214 RepID=UPI0035653F4E